MCLCTISSLSAKSMFSLNRYVHGYTTCAGCQFTHIFIHLQSVFLFCCVCVLSLVRRCRVHFTAYLDLICITCVHRYRNFPEYYSIVMRRFFVSPSASSSIRQTEIQLNPKNYSSEMKMVKIVAKKWKEEAVRASENSQQTHILNGENTNKITNVWQKWTISRHKSQSEKIVIIKKNLLGCSKCVCVCV